MNSKESYRSFWGISHAECSQCSRRLRRQAVRQTGIKFDSDVVDAISGMVAIGVLGALYEREKSGKEQCITPA